MRIVGAIAVILGVALFGGAKSAIHEIESLICFLIAVTAFGFAGAIDHLKRNEEMTAKAGNLVKDTLLFKINEDSRDHQY